ncbi:MAG TPA: hypothetical protein VHT27_02980 [Solirubrobacteraceae bacterium]|nr:hypothetical protein [Solirubrobacteraceae bacterium]
MPIIPQFDPTPGSELDVALSELLMRLGFEPGWPVYQHDEQYYGVSLERLRDAMFASTYTEPRLVRLQARIPPPTDDQDIADVPMLVETMTQVYVDLRDENAGYAVPLRPRESPHYYLGGALYNNSYQHADERVRMHAYCDFITPEALSAIYIQLVPRDQPQGIAEGPLKWASVPPGEL